MALLTYNGGVPASLRGLHAWLAHFSPLLAREVIKSDPYGVLRYGDADGLSASQGDVLLGALEALSKKDPYFRSEDWAHHTARGLAHPELADKIRTLVLSPTSAPQLRSLLLDALKGSPAAALLRDALRDMLMTDGNGAFEYADRIGAAEALIGLKNPVDDWPSVVKTLSYRTSADARHLAIDILIAAGTDEFDVESIVDTVLGYLGRLPGLEASPDAVDGVGPLYFLARRVPAEKLGAVLDRFFARNPSDKLVGWKTEYALNDFINTLIARQLGHEAPEPMRLMGWLRTLSPRRSHSGDERQAIGEFIKAHPDFRRAIQEQVLLVETDDESAWGRAWGLQEADPALMPDVDDIVVLLRSTRLSPLTDPSVREMWKDVIRLSARREGLPQIVADIANAHPPWHRNRINQLERRPKLFIRDSGLLHGLRACPTQNHVDGTPGLVGESWEGFCIEALIAAAGEGVEAFHYRWDNEEEIDLVLEFSPDRRWAIEIKHSQDPRPSKGFYRACEAIGTERRMFVHRGEATIAVGDGIPAYPLRAAMEEVMRA